MGGGGHLPAAVFVWVVLRAARTPSVSVTNAGARELCDPGEGGDKVWCVKAEWVTNVCYDRQGGLRQGA